MVLRVFDRAGVMMAFVPWGTGTPVDGPEVAVQPGTPVGTALGIYKPTYFRSCNVTICTVDKVTAYGVDCPPRLMLELKDLFGL